MTVATRDQPDVTNQDPSEYVAAIDATTAVDGQIGGQFAPHEAATPNMTVLVDAGILRTGVVLVSKTQQTTTTITAPTTNPRIDRIVIDSTDGTVSVITGTEAASPTAPNLTNTKIPIAQVLLQTSTTQITNSIITDERTTSRETYVPTFLSSELQLGSDTSFSSTQTSIGHATLDSAEAVAVMLNARFLVTGTAGQTANLIFGANVATTPRIQISLEGTSHNATHFTVVKLDSSHDIPYIWDGTATGTTTVDFDVVGYWA